MLSPCFFLHASDYVCSCLCHCLRICHGLWLWLRASSFTLPSSPFHSLDVPRHHSQTLLISLPLSLSGCPLKIFSPPSLKLFPLLVTTRYLCIYNVLRTCHPLGDEKLDRGGRKAHRAQGKLRNTTYYHAINSTILVIILSTSRTHSLHVFVS